MVLILEEDGWVRFCGPAAGAILGLTPDQVEGRPFFSLIGDDVAAEQRAMYASNLAADNPTFTASFTMVHADGTQRHLEAAASNYMRNPDIAGIIMTVRDVTRQKNAEERATFYEYYDPLTRLPNKESFLREVERNIGIADNRGGVFGVMAIGLDKFKAVNDMYGTRIGDDVIRLAAEALRSSFRADDVLSRYRGDTFLALFPDIKSREHIKEIISKAKQAFSLPVDIGLGQEIRVTASMGVSFYPNDGHEAAELVRNAETALYMAKETGKDSYRLFDARLNGELLEQIGRAHV